MSWAREMISRHYHPAISPSVGIVRPRISISTKKVICYPPTPTKCHSGNSVTAADTYHELRGQEGGGGGAHLAGHSGHKTYTHIPSVIIIIIYYYYYYYCCCCCCCLVDDDEVMMMMMMMMMIMNQSKLLCCRCLNNISVTITLL